MFVLSDSDTPEFEWPVVIDVPTNGGKFQKHRITAVFRTIPTERYEELLELPILEQDRNIARECLIGWKDVSDPDGNPVEFSDEARDRLLNLLYVRAAIVRAYADALSGKASRKN